MLEPSSTIAAATQMVFSFSNLFYTELYPMWESGFAFNMYKHHGSLGAARIKLRLVEIHNKVYNYAESSRDTMRGSDSYVIKKSFIRGTN